MTRPIYDLRPDELFRLNAAYVAIRKPAIRAEFLRTLESWAQEQWAAGDDALERQDI